MAVCLAQYGLYVRNSAKLKSFLLLTYMKPKLGQIMLSVGWELYEL